LPETVGLSEPLKIRPLGQYEGKQYSKHFTEKMENKNSATQLPREQ